MESGFHRRSLLPLHELLRPPSHLSFPMAHHPSVDTSPIQERIVPSCIFISFTQSRLSPSPRIGGMACHHAYLAVRSHTGLIRLSERVLIVSSSASLPNGAAKWGTVDQGESGLAHHREQYHSLPSQRLSSFSHVVHAESESPAYDPISPYPASLSDTGYPFPNRIRISTVPTPS